MPLIPAYKRQREEAGESKTNLREETARWHQVYNMSSISGIHSGRRESFFNMSFSLYTGAHVQHFS